MIILILNTLNACLFQFISIRFNTLIDIIIIILYHSSQTLTISKLLPKVGIAVSYYEDGVGSGLALTAPQQLQCHRLISKLDM